MRKLATIREITDIQPIEGADAIEVASVDGWDVVVKKGDFDVNQHVIYLEIDSWVPHELAPFLTRGENPREYHGVRGERLRTIKLRGQVSQGLILPVDVLQSIPHTNLPGGYVQYGDHEPIRLFDTASDLTEILNIQKWEAPISAQLRGVQKGNFPSDLVPKTDQERIQNCIRDITKRPEQTYEKSLKLDGSSCTILRLAGEIRVCSRNMELVISDDNAENTFVKMALKHQNSIGEGYAMQGELMGPGIQGNRENFKEHKFFVFDIYDMIERKYLDPLCRRMVCESVGLDHTPILDRSAPAPSSVKAAIEDVDSISSINHKIAEGVVYKSNIDGFSFKVISNKFLLKEGN